MSVRSQNDDDDAGQTQTRTTRVRTDTPAARLLGIQTLTKRFPFGQPPGYHHLTFKQVSLGTTPSIGMPLPDTQLDGLP